MNTLSIDGTTMTIDIADLTLPYIESMILQNKIETVKIISAKASSSKWIVQHPGFRHISKLILDVEVSIGSYAFFNYKKLVEVDLLKRNKTIGDYAFAYSGLQKLNFLYIESLGNYLFVGTKLESFDHSKALSSAYDTFSYSSIKNFEVSGNSESNKTIINLRLTKITKLNVGPYTNLNSYTGATDLEEIIINNDNTSISDNGFENCNSLKKVVAKNIKMIGSCAFKNCINLETIDMPKLKIIKNMGFYRCEKLELNLDTLPLKSVSDYGFAFCKKIIIFKVNFNVGAYSFADCDSLTELDVHSYEYSLFRKWKNLKSVTIHTNIVSPRMFYRCTSLEAIK